MYNLATDPYESKNLVHEQPAVVAEMRERLSMLEETAIEPFAGPDILEGNPNRNEGVWGPGWCNLPN